MARRHWRARWYPCSHQHCLGLEADNMCRWYGYELAAIHVTLQQSESEFSHHQKSLS